ncbi:hypothetical protein FM038_020630 [Shewanella eurypsychrophilus]|uniref:Uncharacterized protein n=1 Tax=Shewanella eurypsychrophilus TaxID=2593656 RepID=A0ABX6VC86_9GAMM|nr:MULTISPECIES: hypothetical protein [Shewanella]QFU24317.1 hypothetical protein FS418_22345 [Shewanella sp. YLB-09]QPG59517.1 hypothetical protein FM038_020630 [Shewanella eurypsychrophilus]
MVLEDSQTCLSEHELKINKEHLSVIVLPTVIDNEMIRLEFTLNITEPNRDSPVSKQQILNLSSGESLTALVEGDERIKLTTSCSII